ncbi:MAG: hypothetical protein A3E83_03825 [Gammaproteobacteria bacterium RIFCSPHIGHO2_12_FULL_41_20]|nr:MAG: hypothetical protein A3E83_03825 [Gammaproteobacteria bacterium RIFCSPHIGHO2_12_FULL_41_20]
MNPYLAYRIAIINDEIHIRSSAIYKDDVTISDIEISIDNQHWIKLHDFLLHNNWEKTIAWEKAIPKEKAMSWEKVFAKVPQWIPGANTPSSAHPIPPPPTLFTSMRNPKDSANITAAEAKAVAIYVNDSMDYKHIKDLFNPQHKIPLCSNTLDDIKKNLKLLILMQSAYNKARIAQPRSSVEVYRNIDSTQDEVVGNIDQPGSLITVQSVASTTRSPKPYNSRKIKIKIRAGSDAIPLEIINKMLAHHQGEEQENFMGVRPTFITLGKKFNVDHYELTLMPRKQEYSSESPRSLYQIALETTEKGLRYEVSDSQWHHYSRARVGIIAWDDLPNDFPRDATTLIQAGKQYLPIILDKTSKAGHTQVEYEVIYAPLKFQELMLKVKKILKEKAKAKKKQTTPSPSPKI